MAKNVTMDMKLLDELTDKTRSVKGRRTHALFPFLLQMDGISATSHQKLRKESSQLDKDLYSMLIADEEEPDIAQHLFESIYDLRTLVVLDGYLLTT